MGKALSETGYDSRNPKHKEDTFSVRGVGYTGKPKNINNPKPESPPSTNKPIVNPVAPNNNKNPAVPNNNSNDYKSSLEMMKMQNRVENLEGKIKQYQNEIAKLSEENNKNNTKEREVNNKKIEQLQREIDIFEKLRKESEENRKSREANNDDKINELKKQLSQSNKENEKQNKQLEELASNQKNLEKKGDENDSDKKGKYSTSIEGFIRSSKIPIENNESFAPIMEKVKNKSNDEDDEENEFEESEKQNSETDILEFDLNEEVLIKSRGYETAEVGQKDKEKIEDAKKPFKKDDVSANINPDYPTVLIKLPKDRLSSRKVALEVVLGIETKFPDEQFYISKKDGNLEIKCSSVDFQKQIKELMIKIANSGVDITKISNKKPNLIKNINNKLKPLEFQINCDKHSKIVMQTAKDEVIGYHRQNLEIKDLRGRDSIVPLDCYRLISNEVFSSESKDGTLCHKKVDRYIARLPDKKIPIAERLKLDNYYRKLISEASCESKLVIELNKEMPDKIKTLVSRIVRDLNRQITDDSKKIKIITGKDESLLNYNNNIAIMSFSSQQDLLNSLNQDVQKQESDSKNTTKNSTESKVFMRNKKSEPKQNNEGEQHDEQNKKRHTHKSPHPANFQEKITQRTSVMAK